MNEIEELRAQMRAHTELDELPADMTERVHSASGRRRRRRAAGAVVLVVLAAGGALALGRGGGAPDGLDRAVPAPAPQVPPTDDQISAARWWSWATDYYQRTPDPSGTPFTESSLQHNYVARDGRTLLSSRAGQAPVPQPATSDAFARLAAEPTDPAALRGAFASRNLGVAPSDYLVQALWPLLRGPAPLAFREAAVQVLRDEPGLAQSVGVDSRGRPGLVFRSSTAQESWQIVIDEASLRPLETTYEPVYAQAPGIALQRWTESDWSVEDPPGTAGTAGTAGD